MSIAAVQANKFYEQTAQDQVVFTFEDENGLLVYRIQEKEVVPFWSSRSRLEKVQSYHPKYSSYEITEIPLTEFLGPLLSMLKEQQIQVGVNWSGSRLVGYDVAPDDIKSNIEYWLARESGTG